MRKHIIRGRKTHMNIQTVIATRSFLVENVILPSPAWTNSNKSFILPTLKARKKSISWPHVRVNENILSTCRGHVYWSPYSCSCCVKFLLEHTEIIRRISETICAEWTSERKAPLYGSIRDCVPMATNGHQAKVAPTARSQAMIGLHRTTDPTMIRCYIMPRCHEDDSLPKSVCDVNMILSSARNFDAVGMSLVPVSELLELKHRTRLESCILWSILIFKRCSSHQIT